MSKKITVVRVPADPEEPMRFAEIDNGYQALQAEVGGLFDCIDLTDRLTMWFHDEGKLIGLPANPRATSWLARAGGIMGDYVAGPVVLTGGVDADGDTLGVTTEALIAFHVEPVFDAPAPAVPRG